MISILKGAFKALPAWPLPTQGPHPLLCLPSALLFATLLYFLLPKDLYPSHFLSLNDFKTNSYFWFGIQPDVTSSRKASVTLPVG